MKTKEEMKKKHIWNTHLTKAQAIKMYKSNWWEGKTDEEIVKFQLFEERSCMPFSLFHAAIEKVLGRSVWTHEFGLNWDGLQREYLGEKPKPTMADIVDLIPNSKRVILIEK